MTPSSDSGPAIWPCWCASVRLRRIEALIGALPDSVMLLNRGLVLALSAWLVMEGRMTVGRWPPSRP